jgi:hypothetical protein
MQKVLALARDYWQALALAVAAITAALTITSLVDWIRPNLARNLDQENGQTLLNMGWSWVIAVIVILFVASLLFSGILLTRLKKSEEVIAHKMALCSKTLTGMILAATKITNKLYPPAAIPPFSIETIQITTSVHEDGSSTVKAEYRIKAHGINPVNFWEIAIGAETVAPPVEFLDEIDFKIKDKQGAERVAYMVTRNETHNKEISVYFLPQLMPGEAAREIVYTYGWPQMMKGLLEKGYEEFRFEELRSRTAVSQMDYVMYFHPKLWSSRKLSCAIVSSAVAGNLSEEDSQDLGWRGWRYRVLNVPAQGFAYKLLFEAKK